MKGRIENMIDISKISELYEVRLLNDSDIDRMLDLCLRNTLFNHYCRIDPTAELLLDDMHTTPNGSLMINKYYLGYFKDNELVAMLDYVDEWPIQDAGYIRFYIVEKQFQGKQVGTTILRQLFRYLKAIGREKVVCAVVADNPQAEHFWKKNGFTIIDTFSVDELNLNANILEKYFVD